MGNTFDSTMKTITHGMADLAMKDPNFVSVFPEFKQVTPGPAVPTTGCKSCGQRRAAAAAQSSFFKVMAGLSVDRLKELKGYFGLTEMLVTTRDQNGGVQLKVV